MSPPTLLWFRRDLRLTDHPALQNEQKIIPLFILDDETRTVGGASRWWLHHSLKALNDSLDGKLVLRRGNALEMLKQVMRETGATSVQWSRCYEADSIARDSVIKQALPAESHNASLLFEPWTIQTKSKTPFQVFTPFWKSCRAAPDPSRPTLPNCTFLTAPSEKLEDWNLLPTKPDWAKGLHETWQVGETAAQQKLEKFILTHLNGYAKNRDIPSVSGTSLLSPHLHWGEISPRQIWHAVRGAEAAGLASTEDADKFLAELGWREFCHHLLFHIPTLPILALNKKFRSFPWNENESHLRAWQNGQTGYPIVDAGMRQLWQTGWMHNRVRMIVGSFLVKDLLLPWQRGEEWFWDTLVDANPASNAAGWQWIAGCGADAAPFFRIFNPVLQGEKFDPEGQYVRRYVPELEGLPNKYIHRPWEAPTPPTNYPPPIIDHSEARKKALAALHAITSDPTNLTC